MHNLETPQIKAFAGYALGLGSLEGGVDPKLLRMYKHSWNESGTGTGTVLE